jgi:hypothetical protein
MFISTDASPAMSIISDCGAPAAPIAAGSP